MTQQEPKPPRSWFVVKRTKHSKSYQFYEPNEKNRETIDLIAPDGGDYEVIELVDRSALTELQEERDQLVDTVRDYLVMIERIRKQLTILQSECTVFCDDAGYRIHEDSGHYIARALAQVLEMEPK